MAAADIRALLAGQTLAQLPAPAAALAIIQQQQQQQHYGQHYHPPYQQQYQQQQRAMPPPGVLLCFAGSMTVIFVVYQVFVTCLPTCACAVWSP
jgi:hypothetical protein